MATQGLMMVAIFKHVTWKLVSLAWEARGGRSTSAMRYVVMVVTSSTMTVMMVMLRMVMVVTVYAKWRQGGDAHMVILSILMIVGNILPISLTMG